MTASYPSACARSGDMPLAALDLNAREYAVLMATRYFFAAFARPEGHSWVNVVLGARDFFPVENHAVIIQTVLAMVQDIRVSRRSTLRFSNPYCRGCAGFVTPEERHMIQMLRGVGANEMSRATTSAMMLCEGNSTLALIATARRLLSVIETASFAGADSPVALCPAVRLQ